MYNLHIFIIVFCIFNNRLRVCPRVIKMLSNKLSKIGSQAEISKEKGNYTTFKLI